MLALEQKSCLILDYDGTLAPFVKERDQAYPYPGVWERLLRIKETSRLIIMSGRALKDLLPLLGDCTGIELWGSHGAEYLTKKGEYSCLDLPEEVQDGLQEALYRCESSLSIENYEIKPTSIAVHGSHEKVLASFEVIAMHPLFEVHHFHQGFELRPRFVSKGYAINTILKEDSDYTIAYLGDDATDEDAFAALGDLGLKVLVQEKPRATKADICIKPPEELLEFLDHWIKTWT